MQPEIQLKLDKEYMVNTHREDVERMPIFLFYTPSISSVLFLFVAFSVHPIVVLYSKLNGTFILPNRVLNIRRRSFVRCTRPPGSSAMFRQSYFALAARCPVNDVDRGTFFTALNHIVKMVSCFMLARV